MLDINKNSIVIGLCEGRHDLPVSDYIFEGKIDPTDFVKMKKIAFDFVSSIPDDVKEVNVYVTGLTSAMLSVVWACNIKDKILIAYHWDKELKTYIPQRVLP